MKPGWLATTMLAETATAFATLPCNPTLFVTLENGQMAPAVQLAQAEGMTTRIFAQIGIRAVWRSGAILVTPPCSEAVTIVLDEGTPPGRFSADAMAYATLSEAGKAIHVFYLRIAAEHMRELIAPLLGHVFAHEIAHVLEDAARHSAEGVLKAHWTQDDFSAMSAHPLSFDPVDAALIRARFGL